jgi:hypothetical protein
MSVSASVDSTGGLADAASRVSGADRSTGELVYVTSPFAVGIDRRSAAERQRSLQRECLSLPAF